MLFSPCKVCLAVVTFGLILSGCSKQPDRAHKEQHWKKSYTRIIQRSNEAARESREMLESQLKADLKDSSFHKYLVIEAYKRDLNPIAYAHLKVLQKERYGDVELQRLVGKILREEGFIDESVTYLAHRFSLEPRDAELFSELLRTHVFADSLDEAYKLLDSTDLPQKSPMYYDVASRIQEHHKNHKEAFASLFDSLKERSYSLGSSCFKNLARLARALGYPLVDQHFYSLYRPRSDPEDVAALYSDMGNPPPYSITDSVLTVTLTDRKTLAFAYQVTIFTDTEAGVLVIPILLPNGTSTPSVLSVLPVRDFTCVQKSNGKTRLHEITFADSVHKDAVLRFEIEFEKSVDFGVNRPWIWEEIPIVHPTRLHLNSSWDFGVDMPGIIRENRKEGLDLSAHHIGSGHELRPTAPRMFFMPAVSFSQSTGILYVGNKIASFATFFALVALLAAMIMHYKGSRGVGWALLIFSVVYAGPIFLNVIPSTFVPDVPDIILGKLFSPAQGFPQELLAAALGCLVMLVTPLAAWLMATHKEQFDIPGERLAIVYLPVMFPLGLASYLLFSASREITRNIGWCIPVYVFALAFLFLIGCLYFLLRQSREDKTTRLIGLVVGMVVGMVIAALAVKHPWLRIPAQVVFALCVSSLLVNIWLHYRRIRGKLPKVVSGPVPLLQRLQVEVSEVLDRYQVLFHVAAIISGIAVFVSTMMVILRIGK